MRDIVDHRHTPVGEIQLQRRGEDYEIIINGVFIMASYNGRSERAMVREGLRALGALPRKIGVAGLGMGLTVSEALSSPQVESVTVFEVEEAIIDWNRGPLAEINCRCLYDARVSVVVGDFVDALPDLASYDLLCVDLDNGPEMVTISGNSRLYTLWGMEMLKGAVGRPGAVSIWCPRQHEPLHELFMHSFDDVRVLTGEDCVYTGVVR